MDKVSAMSALLQHNYVQSTKTIMRLLRVSKRITLALVNDRSLVLDSWQSRRLYRRRKEPYAARLLARYVHTMDLTGAHFVKDASMLGNLAKLDLTNTQVEDVSALGRVRVLSLRGAPVTDVSALGGVDTLDINRTLVTDESALSGVRVLWLATRDAYRVLSGENPWPDPW